MPSPMGHTIAGLCGYLLAPMGSIPKPKQNALLASIVLANLPDIDILPGLLLGNPTLYHRELTHSITVSILVGVLASICGRAWKQTSLESIKLGIWVTAVYFSHIFLDMLVADASPPSGVQLLWPFSTDYFILPITIFGGFDYFDAQLGMVRTLLSLKNFMTMLREFIIMIPIYGFTYYLTHRFKWKQKS